MAKRLIFFGGTRERNNDGKERPVGKAHNWAFYHAGKNVQNDYKDFAATGEFTVYLDFNEDLLPGLERHRIAESLLMLVDACLENPDARIADLLLSPGESFRYNGGEHVYPDIRLVYWGGGNPFHHHQDLTRLARALDRPTLSP